MMPNDETWEVDFEEIWRMNMEAGLDTKSAIKDFMDHQLTLARREEREEVLNGLFNRINKRSTEDFLAAAALLQLDSPTSITRNEETR